MKQVVYKQYGEAEVLKIIDTPRPRIKRKNTILVKVSYSSLNAIDWKNRKGHFRLVSGLFKPRTKQGFDVVGVIVDKATNLTKYEIGDKIIGQLGNFSGGSFSEYVTLTSNQFIKAPTNITDEQLGGLGMAGVTAWQALFENAALKANDKVLINGGSGGVGHMAIQIARAYGAEVTSVSSKSNFDFCKKMGADYTIDYATEDFTKRNKKFDIIFDVVFNSSYSKVKNILEPNGIYIGTTPSLELIKDTFFTKSAKFVAVQPNRKALNDLARLITNNLLLIKIDKIFNLNEIIEANKYVEKSRTIGKVIIKIASE
jgi:NADPH:quinone reductase-like Zn-dependent oxidoreductase